MLFTIVSHQKVILVGSAELLNSLVFDTWIVQAS